jgi:putative FmdB family regulatory protein
MPTYEYKCPNGHLFEKFYPTMGTKRRAVCPQCGKRGEQLISGGAGLVFKGSGFYITDYKRAGAKPGDGEAKPGDAKPEAARAADTAAKPDAEKPRDGKKKDRSSSDK